MIHSKKVLALSCLLLLVTACSGTAPASDTASGTTTPTTSTKSAPTTPAPIYMTTMTHMEDGTGWTDDQDKGLFELHVKMLRWGMDLFDQYGAKMTVETNTPFAKANGEWGLNFLKEIVDRGHGVGSHIHLGEADTPPTYAQNVAQMKELKALVDAAVGPENDQGINGAAGRYGYNWVQAVVDAGYHYTDGLSGFAYLAVPLKDRPSGWTDTAIKSTYFHDPVPDDLQQRTTPYDLADASDLTPDDPGILAVTDGSLGEIRSLAEGRKSCPEKNGDCPLTMDDVNAFFTMTDEALAEHDPSKVGKINVHIELSMLVSENEAILKALLSGIKTRYIDTGKMVWATQVQAYEGYEAWKAQH